MEPCLTIHGSNHREAHVLPASINPSASETLPHNGSDYDTNGDGSCGANVHMKIDNGNAAAAGGGNYSNGTVIGEGVGGRQQQQQLHVSIDEVLHNWVGEFGRAQILHFTFTSLAWTLEALHTLVNIFADKTPAWRCIPAGLHETSHFNNVINGEASGSFNSSSRYNNYSSAAYNCTPASSICSMDRSLWEWVSRSQSTVSEWDLICGNSYKQGLAQSAFFIGCLLGAGVFGSLSDSRLGRKGALAVACVGAVLSGMLTAASPGYALYMLGRAATGVSGGGLGLTSFVLATEMIGPSRRTAAAMCSLYFFPLGMLLLSALASLRAARANWRVLYVLTSAPTLVYCLVILPFLAESPRWYLVRGRAQDALRVLKSIASCNGNGALVPDHVTLVSACIPDIELYPQLHHAATPPPAGPLIVSTPPIKDVLHTRPCHDQYYIINSTAAAATAQPNSVPARYDQPCPNKEVDPLNHNLYDVLEQQLVQAGNQHLHSEEETVATLSPSAVSVVDNYTGNCNSMQVVQPQPHTSDKYCFDKQLAASSNGKSINQGVELSTLALKNNQPLAADDHTMRNKTAADHLIGHRQLDINKLEEAEDEKAATGTLVDVFKGRDTRTRMVILVCVWFSCALGYYSVNLNVGNLGTNVYLTVALNAVAELPGYVVTALLLNRLGRRTTLIVALLVSGASALAGGIASWELAQHHHHHKEGAGDSRGKGGIVEMVAGLLGLFAIAGIYNLLFLYTAELFPTVVRNAALGLANQAAAIGSIIAPMVVLSAQAHSSLPFLIIGVASILSALMAIKLPETLNRPFHETLEAMRKAELTPALQ